MWVKQLKMKQNSLDLSIGLYSTSATGLLMIL
jgi:hypothetical protein